MSLYQIYILLLERKRWREGKTENNCPSVVMVNIWCVSVRTAE